MENTMLSIVDCPCCNPLPHKKFLLRKDNLDFFSAGFFSIAEGKEILSIALTTDQINEDDRVDMEHALISCGLPKQTPTNGATAGKNSDYTLLHFTIVLMNLNPNLREINIGLAIEHAFLSHSEADKVREYFQQSIETLRENAKSLSS